MDDSGDSDEERHSSPLDIVTPDSHKAPVWMHFGFCRDDSSGRIIIGSKAVCKLCKKEVARSGGTTNLINHLRIHHRAEFEVLMEGDEAGSSGQQKIDAYYQKPTVNLLVPGSKRAQELIGAVVEFIVRDLRPVRVVDCSGFLHLMKVAEPRYVVPCRRTVTNYIDKQYIALRNTVEQELKDVQYLGLTTDMWTSRANDGYISLTAHYITPTFQMVHRNLQSCPFPGNHTAINIAELLGKMADNWCIDISSQVIAVTTDNAKNITNAITEELMLIMIPCAGHTLNLSVQRGLAVPELSTTLARCRKIVEYFNRSRIDNEELKAKQKQLEIPQHNLIQEVITRWNSTFDMISRLCEQQAAIAAVLHVKRDLHHLELSPREWHNLEDLINLLGPFKSSTEVLSGQKYPTLSCLAAILSDLNCKLVDQPGESSALRAIKLAMRRDFNERYQNENVQALMNKVAFLDPRFKNFPHLSTMQSLTLLEKVFHLPYKKKWFRFLRNCQLTQMILRLLTVVKLKHLLLKRKKIHPLRKLLGDNFGGPSSSTTSDNTTEDNVQA